MKHAWIWVALLLLTACSSDPQQKSRAPADMPMVAVDARRLEIDMKQAPAELKTADTLAVFAKHFRADRKFLLCWWQDAPPPVADTLNWTLAEPLMAADWLRLCADPAIQQLLDSTLKAHPTDPLAPLAAPLSRFHYFFPKAPVPRVRSMVWGHDPRQHWGPQYARDRLYFDGQYLGVGLDYFSGPRFPMLHPQIPLFVRKRTTPAHLPVAAMSLIAEHLQPPLGDDNNPTLLDHIVHAGVGLYFLDQVLPDTPDSLKIYYSPQQMALVERDEAVIYRKLIPLLYSRSSLEYGWVVRDGPNSSGHAPEEAPARLGAFIGWRLVRKYMAEHPDVTLAQLMKRTDYEEIFKASNYKPLDK